MASYFIILAAVITLFCGRVSGYQVPDGLAKSDTFYADPESSMVPMKKGFEPAELIPVESQELRFAITDNYPNPF